MNILKSIIKSALKEKFTTEEIRDKRLGKCKTCPNLINEKCILCGCFVEIKAELDYHKNPKKFFRIEKTHCEDGKWPFIDDDGNEHENDLELANYYKNL